MITMLECTHCDARFDEALAEQIPDPEPYEFWGQVGIQNNVILSCPFCGCEELSDARPETEEAA